MQNYTKIQLVREMLRQNEHKDEKQIVKNLYANIEGDIFKLVEPECYICETEPHGQLHFAYDYSANGYRLICNRDHEHIYKFDITKKYD